MVCRQIQKEQTRSKILASAATCFAQKSFAGCSVADIAAGAGVSAGNIYVHFKSKEDLFLCMIREEYAGGIAKMRTLTGPSYLDGILEALLDCIRHVGFPIDHRLWTEIMAVAARDARVREVYAAGDKAMRTTLTEALRKAVEAGEVEPELDLEAVSLWLYALVDGFIARTAIDPQHDLEKSCRNFETLVRRALGCRNNP